MSVYLASQLKIRTLIIVDKQELMKQWIKAFLEFTDLTVDDIGIVQQKNFGVDRPVIIAMGQTLQSYLKKGIKEAFKLFDKNRIGFVIYDEVHTTSSAPVFSKISLLFRTRNILGLSATPFHTGLSEILMKNTIGEIIYETKNYDLRPEYHLVYYKSNLDSKKLYLLSKITDFLQRKALYNKFIVESQNYVDLITAQSKKMRDLGHRIIIICFTKAQVMKISDELTNKGLENTRFFGDERDIDYTENILVATYSFAGKG
jgi:superfamily II DNA or RNA helicase